MSKCIVVLGMHGGGTSLVAGILHALGVDMNYNPNARVKWYTNYEDTDIVRINNQILRDSGGDWYKAPTEDSITTLSQDRKTTRKIKKAIAARDNGCKLWGFKDPRSALTVSLFHPHLPNPHYIHVMRNHDDVARSIQSRGPSNRDDAYWVELSKIHHQRIQDFLYDLPDDVPTLVVQFSGLTGNDKRSRMEVEEIAKFIGVDDVTEGLKMIQRDKVLIK